EPLQFLRVAAIPRERVGVLPRPVNHIDLRTAIEYGFDHVQVEPVLDSSHQNRPTIFVFEGRIRPTLEEHGQNLARLAPHPVDLRRILARDKSRCESFIYRTAAPVLEKIASVEFLAPPNQKGDGVGPMRSYRQNQWRFARFVPRAAC